MMCVSSVVLDLCNLRRSIDLKSKNFLLLIVCQRNIDPIIQSGKLAFSRLKKITSLVVVLFCCVLSSILWSLLCYLYIYSWFNKRIWIVQLVRFQERWSYFYTSEDMRCCRYPSFVWKCFICVFITLIYENQIIIFKNIETESIVFNIFYYYKYEVLVLCGNRYHVYTN